MNVEKGKTYRIKSDSPYFLDKYGTPNPSIIIEGADKEVFGKDWGMMNGNPTCIAYAVRRGFDRSIQPTGQVYYGKINGLGELVHESELEAN